MNFQEFHENHEISQKRDTFSPTCKNTNETNAFLMILEVIFHRNRTFRRNQRISLLFAKFSEIPQNSLKLVIFTNFWCFGPIWGPQSPNFVELLYF